MITFAKKEKPDIKKLTKTFAELKIGDVFMLFTDDDTWDVINGRVDIEETTDYTFVKTSVDHAAYIDDCLGLFPLEEDETCYSDVFDEDARLVKVGTAELIVRGL